MKILITGSKGMLGQMMAQVLSGHDLTLTDREEMDVTDKLKVYKVIKLVKPDMIIHAAAFVDVERAESDPELAKMINVDGSRNIAFAAKEVGATVIYISTDYVFDGEKRIPYTEDDEANPLGVYAKTKFLGEREIIKGCPEHYILRVSWLFGECLGGRNFVKTMIDLSSSKDEIKVINDQIGSPTYTRDIAKIVSQIADNIEAKKPIHWGIYNFSGEGETTRFDFTKEIFRQALIKTKLTPISAKEFFAKAPRPAYSYLDKSKIEKALKINVRTWQEMLKDYFSRETSSEA